MDKFSSDLFKWSALFVISFVAFFWRLGDVSFLEIEGMYATIVNEMISSGDWVTLRFNEVRYFEKPPLWFWLTSATVWAMGASEFSIRLWGALSALALVILTYLLGRKLVNEQGGFFAGLILASSFILPLSARRTSTDLLFCVFVTLSIYGFAGTVQQSSRSLWYPMLFFLGSALSVLSKGLIGLLFPLVIPGIYLLAVWDFGVVRRLRPMLGILLFLLLTVPWHLAASLQNEGFLSYYLVDHHFLRFLGSRNFPHYDISASTTGFILLTIPWFFPWSVFLPLAIVDLGRQARWFMARKTKGRDQLWLLIPIWILVVFGFFAASSFKHEYYALPAFPALAILVGRLCAKWPSRQGSKVKNALLIRVGRKHGYQFQSVGHLLLIASAGSILYLAVLFSWRDSFTTENVMMGISYMNASFRVLLDRSILFSHEFGHDVFSLLLQGGVFAFVGFGGAWVLFYKRRAYAAFGVLTTMAVAISLLILPFFGLMEPFYSVKHVSQIINNRTGPHDIIVNEGPLERVGGLKYYTKRAIYILNGEHGSLRFGSTFSDAGHVFLDTDKFVGLWNSSKRVFVVTSNPFRKSALSSILPSNIHEIGQYGLRRLYSNHPIEGEKIEIRTVKIG